MSPRVLLGLAVIALTGCSLIFDGGRYETGGDSDGGMDGGDLDAAGGDAGTDPACDLTGGDTCCSWRDCDGDPAGPFCNFGGSRWSCSFQCDEDLDCRDFPIGHACVSDGMFQVCACESAADCAGAVDGEVCLPAAGGIRGCGCGDDSECNDPDYPFCGDDAFGIPTCVSCFGDTDCDSGDRCLMGFCEESCINDDDCDAPNRCLGGLCRQCDTDGDGFELPECMPMGPPDCDDVNPAIFPGAEPQCGTGILEDCDAGRWTPLEGVFGAQEVGVAATLMAPGAFRDATDLSVVLPRPGLVYAAVLQGGQPQIFRTATDVGLARLAAPTSPISRCGGLTRVTFDSVQAMRLAADDMGKVLLALAGTTGAEAIVALYELGADDTWSSVSCEPRAAAGLALDIAIAPDAMTVAVLWQGTAMVDSEVQWMSLTANGTHPNTQSDPHWIAGSGDIIAGRNVDTGMSGVWFLDGIGAQLHYRGLDTLAAAFTGRGAFASASPARGDYAHLIGDAANLFLVRGLCSAAVAGSCGTPTVTRLDISWPSSETAMLAGADVAGTYMAIAHRGRAPDGADEIQLTGVPYTGAVAARGFVPVFGSVEGGGMPTPITVRDVAVDAFRDADRSEVAVGFIVDDGSMVGLGVRLMRMCDVR